MKGKKDIRFIYTRLDGIDYFVEKLSGRYLAISRYAPDHIRGRAEVVNVDDLRYFEGVEDLVAKIG